MPTNHKTTAREWLTMQDIADELLCHPRTVERLVSSGDLESITFGRLRRVSRAMLDRYLAIET